MKSFSLYIDNMVVAEDQSKEKINNLTYWVKNFTGVRVIKILIDNKYSFKYKEDLDFPDEIKLFLFDFEIVLREKDDSLIEHWNEKMDKIKGKQIESKIN